MKRTRDESLELYQKWCQAWYGEGSDVIEDYGYMVICNTRLDMEQVLSARSDGWLFCGQLEDNYVFTWEGNV